MIHNVVIVTLVACVASGIAQTPVNQCKNGAPLPDKITLTDDDVVCTAQPCKIVIGTTIDISFGFTTPTFLENIKPNMLATAAGVTIPWNLGNDACDYITSTTCPVDQGEYIQYDQGMKIGKFPEIKVNLEMSIINKDNNASVTCFNFDIQVTS